MVDITSVIEGTVKFRDGKKWKSRWCVMRKLSPVADCLHLQLYRDSKDRYKHGQTKASLSLQYFLGVESGFTLDKESNTVAIICQDVIVVLAFDTRERLIQWQVKISTNLGDDIQYLVLVSSSPPKAKLQTGPARMHVQDHRFCLTTGVPPRLAGLWGIGHLRRYGVVDGRFCFEGGSSCGKGEGLYVFVSDQGDEITHTLKLASQARLSSKKRPTARKLSALDSPRKQVTSQIPDVIHEHNCLSQSEQTMNTCTCHSSTYWPSQESRDIDSNYGCGDTVSVSESNDCYNDSDLYPRSVTNMERCMSCISKLGAPSMSRSSTVTSSTPGAGPCPSWPSIDHIQQQHQQQHQHQINCPIFNQQFTNNVTIVTDSMSLGSHGSSNSSEYSVPRTVCKLPQTTESWYEKIPTSSSSTTSTILPTNNDRTIISPCQCCPPNRPPKPKITKPKMPLPVISNVNIGPYENYDIPKTPIMVEAENYDTPKKIKEYLAQTTHVDQNSNTDMVYGNYDLPATIVATSTTTKSMCGCGIVTGKNLEHDNNKDSVPRIDCTCNRVMSWADNWITLPYCKRGNGIENTGVPINRVRLSGEGKMPVMQPITGELAIYATVDKTKKINRRPNDDTLLPCECPKLVGNLSQIKNNKENNQINYMNINIINDNDKEQLLMNLNENNSIIGTNYVNLDFAQSLEHYENAKEVLNKSQILPHNNEKNTANDYHLQQIQPDNCLKLCHKCGHHTNNINMQTPTSTVDIIEEINDAIVSDNNKQEDYMMMEPGKIPSTFPGYIPMAPAAPSSTAAVVANSINPPPLPCKADMLKRIIGEKSASNPALCGPTVDRSRKRSKNERMTGTAMMLLCRNAGSPYNRKLLMDNTDLLPIELKRLATRKRSSSAESSNVVENSDEYEYGEETSFNHVEGRRSSSPCLHQETELCEDESCCTKISVISTETEDSTNTSQANSQISQLNYIRRSASVPCKGQNRDSSSSNDSGVSTGSLRQRGGDFSELEMPLSNSMTVKKYQKHILPTLSCVHSSLPRRSKSFDPLREISFQFQKIKKPEKSTSAEAEVPVCPQKSKGFASPSDGNTIGPPYIDSRSTSSGTSDMSDYIETLSLSSHSSSDAPDGLKLIRQATATLRPRSGKEYQNIDRSVIGLAQQQQQQQQQSDNNIKQITNTRIILPCSTNYANITPVPENSESPSPGYQSGGSSQETIQSDHFLFKNESTKT